MRLSACVEETRQTSADLGRIRNSLISRHRRRQTNTSPGATCGYSVTLSLFHSFNMPYQARGGAYAAWNPGTPPKGILNRAGHSDRKNRVAGHRNADRRSSARLCAPLWFLSEIPCVGLLDVRNQAIVAQSCTEKMPSLTGVVSGYGQYVDRSLRVAALWRALPVRRAPSGW